MDPKEKENNEKPNEAVETPPTSADIAGGKVAGIVKKLETRISVLEDSNKTLNERNKSLEDKVGTLAKLPSQTGKKSLLDDLEEFVFGPKAPPSNPTIPPTT